MSRLLVSLIGRDASGSFGHFGSPSGAVVAPIAVSRARIRSLQPLLGTGIICGQVHAYDVVDLSLLPFCHEKNRRTRGCGLAKYRE